MAGMLTKPRPSCWQRARSGRAGNSRYLFARRSGRMIKRPHIALISLAAVLLAVTLGAASASASPVAGGEDGTPATTFQVTGLTGGTTYYFEVTAVDRGNNESASSDEKQATTPPVESPGDGQAGSPGGGGSPGDGGSPPAGVTTTPAVVVLPHPSPTGSTGPNGTSSGPWGIVGGLAVVGATIVATVGVRRRRRRSRLASAGPTAPPPSVQVVPDAGPLGAMRIHAAGTGTTHTVRIEPDRGTITARIEEVPPQ